RRKEIARPAKRVRRVHSPAEVVRVPAAPVPRRGHRSPTDVTIASRSHTPVHPRARVATPRDPTPAATRDVDPAPIVKRRPAPVVVADPRVIVVVAPVPRAHVRREITADHARIRLPNG